MNLLRNRVARILAYIFLSCALRGWADTVVIGVAEDEVAEFHLAGVFPSASGIEMFGLADAEYEPDASTDALIHFDTGTALLVEGGYRIVSSEVILQDTLTALGNGAGMFTEASGGMVLEPGPASIFSPGTHVGAFTIEFWLYSGAPREGGIILAWQGSSWLGQNPLFQRLSAQVLNRRVVWQLENFFVRGGEEDGFIGLPVSLSQSDDLVPRRWSHHALRYDPRRNVLEYLVDGLTEDVLHVTDDGSESGTPYTPYVGEFSQPALVLGRNLNGVLDEFRISRTWVAEPQIRRVADTAGWVIFTRRDLRYPGARIESIDLETQNPGMTEVRFLWMLSDRFEEPQAGDERWIDSGDTDRMSMERGRFLYTMVEFLPDGSGRNRPGLFSAGIDYRPEPAPPGPSVVRVEAGAGRVFLSWDRVIRGNPEGYLVFFGTRSGNYLGESATLGESPIDTGSQTSAEITGLDPERVYYFRIGTYNYSNNPVRGQHLPMQFSPEVSARPHW